MTQTVHLKLSLANGGDIKGESSFSDLGRADTIECGSYGYSVSVPTETATALASGKRQYQPVVITKRIDKTSPLLLKALRTNDQVKSATFLFFRPANNADGEEQFYTVTLENGLIAGVTQVSADAIMQGPNAQPVIETVTFTYTKITKSYTNGGISHVDDMSGGGS